MIIKNAIKEKIETYINENKHLFQTDDVYNVNCGLKPRLVAEAVAIGCQECKKNNLSETKDPNKCYLEIFEFGMHYATDHITKISK